MRHFILIASLLFCRLALADDAPPAEPPFKLLAAPKPVSLEEVDKVVEASNRAVQACNKNARRLDTLAVLMTLTIEPDGHVSAAEAVAQDQEGGKLPPETACLQRVARRLKFPASGTLSRVQYPFMLLSQVKRKESP
jgi:hypothetical protein